MKKKFYGALLVGSLFLAGGMVSCSDYDDDINSLNERVDALEKTVAELQKAIEAGAVITNVESTENGVKVTLSDGKTFEVKNGKDGINGADGADGKPGSVIEIREVDGVDYWFLDGENTGYPVKGEKGDQGKPGEDGQDGQDGKDGCWYMPNEDGYWHKQYYNEEGTVVDEKTENSWTDTIKKDVVTVVYDSVNGRLLISNAEGLQEGEVLVIETWGELKSLAVIPYVIDKETSMPVVSFYNIVKDGEVLESTDATAHFRLNPNNANIKDWEWSIIDRKAAVRAEGDNVNDLLAINEISRGDGEMIVSLKSKKSIEDLKNTDEIAIFALNGTNTANGNNIASDYAKVASKDLKNFAIVNASLREFAFVNPYPTEEPHISAKNDAKLVYTESLDLKDLVWTWAKDINVQTSSKVTLEDLDIDGFTYTFEKPEVYLGTDAKTNQQEFVNLDGSIVTVNDYTTAAKGRTPIFIARAFVNGTEIAKGYIKIQIVDAEAVDKEDEVLTVDCGTIEYQDIVAGKEIAALSWTEVNKLYSKYGLSAIKFRDIYNDPVPTKDERGVIVNGDAWMDGQTTSSAAYITMNDTVAVKGMQEAVRTAELTFTTKNNDNTVYPNIVVRFTYTIKDNVTFPALNNDYTIDIDGDGVKDNIVQVKGRMEGNTWTMISSIKEHFANYLEGYTLAKNHTQLYTELPIVVPDPTDPFLMQHGAEITVGEAKVQDIHLTSPLTTDYRDYVVNMNIKRANNEDTTYVYKVRFATPFTITVGNVELETLAKPTTADLFKTIVIKGISGEEIFKNGAVTTKAADYNIDNDYFKFEYALTGYKEDTWESFGNGLSVDDKGIITWNNKGTTLQRDKKATSKVTVTAGKIAILDITTEGNVTVKKSK